VMVIMALDHTREFFHVNGTTLDPTDLTQTTPVLFFTRWVTHFCAPTFVFLSGTSIRLNKEKKNTKDLSLFLLTRGLWLIILEMTLVRFGLVFNLYYDVLVFQVIWVIGASMIVLAGLVFLPSRFILILGLLITFGHYALGAIRLAPGDGFFLPWSLLYQFGFGPITPTMNGLFLYPLLPWLGILLTGYGIGEWFTKKVTSTQRKEILLWSGVSAMVLFVVLRFSNFYGEPSPWSVQKNALFTFMSFLNCSKYPPSLLYSLMTLGPVLICLAWLERSQNKLLSPFIVFGRVPLFYYVLHFYLIHTTALTVYMIKMDVPFSAIDFHFANTFGGITAGWGFGIARVYLIWMTIVLVLYPVCKKYNAYKSTHQHWWLSYV